MRILKIILAILALLVVAVLLIGWMNPVSTYENSFVIDAPVEKSWNTFTDQSKIEEWMPTLKKIETISGKPMEVGSKFKLTFDENGEMVEIFETMTAIDENERFAFDMNTNIFKGKVDVRFSDENGKTKLTAKSDFYGNNVLWKAILYFMKGSIEKNSNEQYQALKKLIESSPN